MSGFSMQCDASPAAKIHRGGSHLTKWAQHVARDLDDRAGTPRKHANQDIDRSRTLLNQTFVFDDAAGHLVPAQSVEQVIDSINARVEQHGGLTPSGKKARALTDDSVIVRPLVMSLDPEWFEEQNPDWKQNGLNDEAKQLHVAMLGWASSFFGAENVRAASLHMDEETPQWQIALVPMTERGQVSQKEVFNGGGMFKQMHRSLREHMRGHGYDASLENVTGDRSRKRFTEKTFKREMRQVDAAQEEVDRLMGAVVAREDAVTEREKSVRRRSRSVDRREEQVKQREEETRRREEQVKQREEQVKQREEQVRRQEAGRATQDALSRARLSDAESLLAEVKDAARRRSLREQIAAEASRLNTRRSPGDRGPQLG